MTAVHNVKAVVFDLGGVLLRLRNPVELFGLRVSETQFFERWLLSPSVREFERGAIDAPEFATSIVREMHLPMSGQEFLERFDAWPECLFPDALALLDAIPATVRRVLLSNTNAVHWGRCDISGELAGCFDRELLSFRTGLLKPDRDAFEQVLRTTGCLPGEILFFDDNPLNVEAACRLGMQAFVSKGPADAANVIRDICRETC